ncbi:MAG: AMP-binding protein [Desulfotalea sp.]
MQLHHCFVDVAKRLGNKEAICDFSTNKKLPYKRALIASLLLSSFFKKYDEDFVGLMLPTSAGCILAKLGLLMSGRTPVMINYSTGADRNAIYAQKKCAFKTIITSKKLLEKIECPYVEGMVYIEDIMESINGLHKAKAAFLASLPASIIKKMIYTAAPHETMVILFTSGSEKDPKAVQLTHENVWANLEALNKIFKFTEDDVFLCSLPYFHVFGMTTSLWLPLLKGMKLLTYANPLDFKKICGIVKENKATFLVGTPSFFWGYLRKAEKGDFDSLRIALSGADKCPDALRKMFREKHGTTLYEGYGATECSPVISANSPMANCPGSVGMPLPGLKVRIENYETGELCDPGEDGRILVKGESVMKGYFNDFEQTSLHIRNGWYDTGDMGNIDENGFLWHVGRLKRFVKIGGEMISLVKIEDIIERFIPEGVLCCVVEIPDARKGAKIIAVLTEKVDEKELRKQMSEHLPKISMPKQFIYQETLPKMGSGKLDFRLVTEMVRKQIN